MEQLPLITGIAAPVVYLSTVVIGGYLTPYYSHLNQPVSALFELGAPYARQVSAAFVFYNFLLVGFSLSSAYYGILPITVSVMIGINGILGLLIESFPMDAPGDPMSRAGMIHIIIAAGLVFTCIGAMGFAALNWHQRITERKYQVLTPVTVGLLFLMFVSGIGSAKAATAGWPLMGLFQRFTIGSYLVWILTIAITLRPEVHPKMD